MIFSGCLTLFVTTARMHRVKNKSQTGLACAEARASPRHESPRGAWYRSVSTLSLVHHSSSGLASPTRWPPASSPRVSSASSFVVLSAEEEFGVRWEANATTSLEPELLVEERSIAIALVSRTIQLCGWRVDWNQRRWTQHRWPRVAGAFVSSGVSTAILKPKCKRSRIGHCSPKIPRSPKIPLSENA